MTTKLYLLSYQQPTIERGARVPGKVWYVSQRPGDGGVDWGYTFEASQAIPLSEHWRQRFVKLHGSKATAVEVGTLKRYREWQGSGLDLGKFLNVGDHVDQDMYDYFLEVLPPASFGRNHVQIGEPYDHRGDNGRARFDTLVRSTSHAQWIYVGPRMIGDLAIEVRP